MEEQKIVILFEFEKDTKRTRRFEETAVTINGEDAVIPASGTLYLQQWACKQAFGELPKAVTVTIQVHED